MDEKYGYFGDLLLQLLQFVNNLYNLQGGGVKGGHLHETTKAWITLIQAVCTGMKMGYTSDQDDTGQDTDGDKCPAGDHDEDPTQMWRKDSSRLIDKRPAVTYDHQARIVILSNF